MNQSSPTSNKISRPLLGVLYIVNSLPGLRTKMLPHVCLEESSIDWPSILNQDFHNEELAAIHWAHSIWFREAASRDPFAFNHLVNPETAKAILNALIVSWGLIEVDL